MSVNQGKFSPCGFCAADAPITEDSAEQRLYECDNCGAVQTIAKTEGAGWWYFGWKHPDGRKLRAPTSQEMRRGLYDWQPA